jgi:pyruvate-ferredoxin/flavodoxin oxidoreductase
VHQWSFLERIERVLRAPGRNGVDEQPVSRPTRVWDRLPVEVQTIVLERGLQLYAIDAAAVAKAAGLAGGQHGHADLLLRACGVLPTDERSPS